MHWTFFILNGLHFLAWLPPTTNCSYLDSISAQFRCSVVSDSLGPDGLQHARLPCLSPTPGACSNSCPSSRWYYPTISSSVVPFSSCPQSFSASGSFPISRFFSWRGQSIGSFSFNNSRSNEHSGLISFRMDWFDLAVRGALKSLLQHHSSKASILWHSAFFIVQLSHPCMTTGKNHHLDEMDLCWPSNVSAF